jgi:hypothetical protein
MCALKLARLQGILSRDFFHLQFFFQQNMAHVCNLAPDVDAKLFSKVHRKFCGNIPFIWTLRSQQVDPWPESCMLFGKTANQILTFSAYSPFIISITIAIVHHRNGSGKSFLS